MSMINQVLHDLEMRQAKIEGAQHLFDDVRIMPPVRRSFGSLLSHALVALSVLAAVLAWQKYHVVQAPVMAVQVASSNLPVVSVESAATSTESVSPTSTEPAVITAAVGSKASVAPVVTETTLAQAQARPAVATPVATAVKVLEATAVRKMTPSTVAVMSDGEDKKSGSQTDAKPSVSMKSPFVDGGIGRAKTVAAQVQSFKITSPQQRSDNAYRQGVLLLQQGNARDAQPFFTQALEANPVNHDARLQLSGVLVDAGRSAEAATLLRDGLVLAPEHGVLSMALARLQVASGARVEALATLEKGLANAGDDAEYHAFMATLLQGGGRHADAIQHYLVALRSDPARTGWLIGIGISLQSENKTSDAAEAFQRALDLGNMSQEMTRFAEQRLKLLRP